MLCVCFRNQKPKFRIKPGPLFISFKTTFSCQTEALTKPNVGVHAVTAKGYKQSVYWFTYIISHMRYLKNKIGIHICRREDKFRSENHHISCVYTKPKSATVISLVFLLLRIRVIKLQRNFCVCVFEMYNKSACFKCVVRTQLCSQGYN